MIFFIVCLRFIAACLITNAHYTDIYPLEIIANGGLLGDVIFFAVSGYCLFHIKSSFPKWYGKRFLRCYIPVLLATAIYMILGAYNTEKHFLVWWYIYPTYYHFVASIVVLYVPYYFIVRFKYLRNRIPIIMVGLAIVQLILYVTIYDRSIYHIDTVREPMIRILFMECMLLGGYFRLHDGKYRDRFSLFPIIGTISLAGLYFISKLMFSKGILNSNYQIINQYILFGFLLLTFRSFCGLDHKLEKLPNWIKKIITFISKITLEIYVVQYVIIDWIRPVGRFPLNWFLITFSIISAAVVLHYVCSYIYKLMRLSHSA